MSAEDTLLSVAEELIVALQPLANALETEVNFSTFMRRLGWDTSVFVAPVVVLGTLIDALDRFFGDDGVDSSQQSAVLDSIAQMFSAIRGLASVAAGDLPPTIDVNEFSATFPQQLIDYLIVDHLLNRRTGIGRLLQILGVIRIYDVPTTGQRLAYTRYDVAWADLAHVLNDPGAIFRNAYHWGASDFDATALLSAVFNYGLGQGFAVSIDTVTEAEAVYLRQGAVPGMLTAADNAIVRWRFLDSPYTDPPVDVGLGLGRLPETPTAKPGFAVMPLLTSDFSFSIPLGDSFSASFSSKVSLVGGLALHVRPGTAPKIEAGFLSGAATASTDFSSKFRYQNSTGDPILLLGEADGSRLEAQAFSVSGGVRLQTWSNPEAFVEVAIDQGRIIINPAAGQADGFLSSILPDQMSVALSLTAGLSSRNGIYFVGSGGLEVQLPVHITLGPIDIESATLVLKPTDAGIPVDLTGTIVANLSVLKATVDKVGMRANFTMPPTGGRLGPFDLVMQFRPPNGVGLSVDAGVVQGGGFLYIDTDRGEYAGALELVVADWLTLTAIGLITTKMPDGSKGFSLLVIITADFGTGIQLGFGFTLIGVGGLVGLNRTMLFQPLMDGVRTGAINGILFPTDVIANAPRIISDLKAIFPPKADTFLIGPMAKLGWGTPPLITLSLGVIIEIPPGDVAILGVLGLAIPEKDPVLILQVNFAGALEFSKKRLYFFASLFDSHILTITIDGEMGVLFAYGADANLVLSVGGFHPQFNPPPLPFPTPKRVQLDIINESDARVRCGGYAAATTNTLQFGAYAEFFFGFSSVSVSGHSSFDALLQWSPFHVIVDVQTTFSVNVGGVGVFSLDIDITVVGPTPWNIHGHGSLSFLFFSVSVPIDITIGDARDTSLPPIAVLPIIGGELSKAANWKAVLPAGSNIRVSLRKLDPTEAAMVLHPVGTLQISQRAVPLDLTIDKVGAQKPTDANRFTLDVTSLGLSKADDLKEPFAPAQFKDFVDAAKLSQPAYTPEHSGIEISAAGVTYASGTAITRRMRYDLTIIDTQYRRYVKQFYVLANSLFVHFLGGARVAFNTFSAATTNRMQPYGQKVAVSNENYAVANQSDNRAYGAGVTTFSSRVSAQDFLDRSVKANPSLAGTLHVLPQFELTP